LRNHGFTVHPYDILIFPVTKWGSVIALGFSQFNHGIVRDSDVIVHVINVN